MDVTAKITRAAGKHAADLTDSQLDFYIQLASSVIQTQEVRGAKDYSAGLRREDVLDEVENLLQALHGADENIARWLGVRVATWAEDAYAEGWYGAQREAIA